jgi:hypothetical protein
MLTAPTKRLLPLGAAVLLALASSGAASAGNSGAQAAREVVMPPRGAAGHGKPARTNNLTFHGGNPGVVTGRDLVYLIFWGSQWANDTAATDPSGEATILANFFYSVGQSSWNNSVTQYCDGVAIGTVTCGTHGEHAVNPTVILGGSWFDNGTAAPAHPTQSQLAAEAVRGAEEFGNTFGGSNSNDTVQYVIATATGNNPSGFGSQYCAWHSWTSSIYGNIAYTNLPYITDAGAACGANFNGLGPNAGITIVAGHEFAETETDIFPNGGWLDSQGAENADKCIWIGSGQGASANVTMPNGSVFPVQSLWSNAFNGGKGGCVLSY